MYVYVDIWRTTIISLKLFFETKWRFRFNSREKRPRKRPADCPELVFYFYHVHKQQFFFPHFSRRLMTDKYSEHTRTKWPWSTKYIYIIVPIGFVGTYVHVLKYRRAWLSYYAILSTCSMCNSTKKKKASS